MKKEIKYHPATILQTILGQNNFLIDYYFDRVKLYLDSFTKRNDVEFILQANPKNDLKDKSLSHHDMLNRRLDIFQPEMFDLSRLKPAGDYAINYVEFSLDFATQDKQALENLAEFFAHHLVYEKKIRSKGKVFYYHNEKYTIYFSPKKQNKILSYYWDKLSRKHEGMSCFHLEFRLKGLDAIKGVNIITINDLLNFDHEAFWNTVLDLKKPNYELLGSSICNDNVTRQAQNKRGNKEWEMIDSLQSYLQVNAQRCHAFERLNDKQLPKWLSSYTA